MNISVYDRFVKRKDKYLFLYTVVLPTSKYYRFYLKSMYQITSSNVVVLPLNVAVVHFIAIIIDIIVIKRFLWLFFYFFFF